MFEVALFAAIVMVVLSAVWSIFYIRRIRLGGGDGSDRLSALQLLPVAFVLANLLYVLPLPIRLLFTKKADGSIASDLLRFVGYFPEALALDALFLTLFAFVFRVTIVHFMPHLSAPARTRRLPVRVFLLLWLALAVVSLLLIVGLARSAGGILPMILRGYGVTDMFVGQGLYAVGMPWLMSLSVLLLAYTRMRGLRVGQWTALLLIALEFAALLLMARRAALVGLGISVLVVWHYLFHRLSRKSLALILLAGFLAMNLLGLLRGGSYTSVSNAVTTLGQKSDSISSSGKLDIFYTLTSGNFILPFQTMPNIMSQMGGQVQLQWGKTSLRALALVIPHALWRDRPEPLSNWYMRKFIDSNAQSNQGVQFFFLSESYLDFGPFGPILWALLYGVGMAWISVWLARRLDNAVYLTLFALLVGNTLNTIASDSFGAVVVFTKVAAAPCLVFLMIAMTGRYRMARS